MCELIAWQYRNKEQTETKPSSCYMKLLFRSPTPPHPSRSSNLASYCLLKCLASEFLSPSLGVCSGFPWRGVDMFSNQHLVEMGCFKFHFFIIIVYFGSLLCAYMCVQVNRPLSLGGHVESQRNKKLCFCTANLALNSRLTKACRAKTKLFIPPILNMAAE